MNSYTNLVQAALDGQGFALIGPPLIEKFLANGALIQPVDAPAIVRHAFHLLLPRGASPSDPSRLFADWVRSFFPERATSVAGNPGSEERDRSHLPVSARVSPVSRSRNGR